MEANELKIGYIYKDTLPQDKKTVISPVLYKGTEKNADYGIIRIGKIATYLECNGKILPVSKATDGKGEINVLTHTFYTDINQAINAIKTK